MSNTFAPDPSARLLRITGLLISQLDPVKGLKTGAARLVVEQLEEMDKEVDHDLSKDVRQLLDSAISSLSPSNSSEPLSYFSCTRVLAHLSSALSRLAEPPTPPAASPISRVPAELVAHIVSFCQDDDLRLRQNTNLALASTCRAFHTAAQPILKREMHLFTPGQVERGAAKVWSGERDHRAVRILSVDLQVADLQLEGNNSTFSWPGRHILPLVATHYNLETLRLRMQPLDDDGNGTLRALAPDAWDPEWDHILRRPAIRDLEIDWHVPDNFDHEAYLTLPFCAYDKLERLRIGNGEHPRCHRPGLLRQAARYLAEGEDPDRDEDFLPPRLKLLAIPWHCITTSDLLSILSPPDKEKYPLWADGLPRMEHLEVLLALEGTLTNQIDQTQKLFTAVQPTLRHLTLRFDETGIIRDTDFRKRYSEAFFSALSQCPKLTTLELGGPSQLRDDWPLDIALTCPPSLRSITFLPHTSLYGVRLFLVRCPPFVKEVTLCVPAAEDWEDWVDGRTDNLREVLALAEGVTRITFKLDVRAEEGRWWLRRGAR